MSRHLASASDFSPTIIHDGIRALLALVHAGTPSGVDTVREAIRAAYFSQSAKSYPDPADQLKHQLKRANNVLISLREYQLIDKGGAFSSVAVEIKDASSDAAAASIFARQILTKLDGTDLLRAVQDLHRQHKRVTKDSLAAELRDSFGFAMPRDTTKHTTMLNWLRTAGVIGADYAVDSARAKALSGVSPSEVDEWQLLPLPQRAFLLALKRFGQVDPNASYAVKAILDSAELEFGTLYRGAQTAKVVVAPLIAGGWIAAGGGASAGRGAKSGSVVAATKLNSVDLAILQGYHVPPLPADLRQQLSKPLDDIKRDLADPDTFVAGIALELLALRMAIALALTPTEMRKRDDKTGGGEVDLVAEGAHLHYSRWLFQCKNQRAAVTVSTLAKEVGMAVLLRAHVIVLATTGRFADSVADYARQVAETTTMQVVLVDGNVVRSFLSSGDASLKEHFHRTAADTLSVKRSQAVI